MSRLCEHIPPVSDADEDMELRDAHFEAAALYRLRCLQERREPVSLLAKLRLRPHAASQNIHFTQMRPEEMVELGSLRRITAHEIARRTRFTHTNRLFDWVQEAEGKTGFVSTSHGAVHGIIIARHVKAHVFLTEVYSLKERGLDHEAIDKIYNFVDSALLAADIAIVDDIFRLADARRLLPAMAISILMATFAPRDRFRFRAEFIKRAADFIRLKWGEDEANELNFYA